MHNKICHQSLRGGKNWHTHVVPVDPVRLPTRGRRRRGLHRPVSTDDVESTVSMGPDTPHLILTASIKGQPFSLRTRRTRPPPHHAFPSLTVPLIRPYPHPSPRTSGSSPAFPSSLHTMCLSDKCSVVIFDYTVPGECIVDARSIRRRKGLSCARKPGTRHQCRRRPHLVHWCPRRFRHPP